MTTETMDSRVNSAGFSPSFERSIARSRRAATASASESSPSDQARTRMIGRLGEAGWSWHEPFVVRE